MVRLLLHEIFNINLTVVTLSGYTGYFYTQHLTFNNNGSLCLSLRLHSGFMCHCFRFTVPCTISTLLTFCSFSLPISNKLLNSLQTALFTSAIAKFHLESFSTKSKLRNETKLLMFLKSNSGNI